MESDTRQLRIPPAAAFRTTPVEHTLLRAFLRAKLRRLMLALDAQAGNTLAAGNRCDVTLDGDTFQLELRVTRHPGLFDQVQAPVPPAALRNGAPSVAWSDLKPIHRALLKAAAGLAEPVKRRRLIALARPAYKYNSSSEGAVTHLLRAGWLVDDGYHRYSLAAGVQLPAA